MFLDVEERLARWQFEHLDALAWPAESDRCHVGHHVGGEHGVVFAAKRHTLTAALDVPSDHAAGLATASAPGNEQLAVAAERERLNEAALKRQYAKQLERLGVVKQRLFLAGDRDDRRPRVGGKRRGAARALGVDDRLQQQMLRHWQRPLWFAAGDRDKPKVECRFLFLFCGA